MDFDAIRDLAKHHKQSFGRILKCEVYRLDDGRLLAITRLHDDYHDINLAILISDSCCIEEIAGKMDRIPYPRCETTPLEMLKALKGIAVLERGAIRKAKERLPRNMGCTHVYEMIEPSFRAIYAGFGGSGSVNEELEDLMKRDLELEEIRQLTLQSPGMADTCYTFNKDSANPEVLERAKKKEKNTHRKLAAIETVKRGE